MIPQIICRKTPAEISVKHNKMQTFGVAFVIAVAAIANVQSAVVGVVPSSTLVRTPTFDSSVIQSERMGASFAYSTAENHAYAAISPIIESVVSPLAVSYSAPSITIPGFAHSAVATPLTYGPAVVVAK